ncbi:hypothetical protein [Nonomuraea dietziae]|uniref:hypothetical protein n=1 Tax=Nonomuraea dietziae TaxID=65515 RepID=UPI0031D4F068
MERRHRIRRIANFVNLSTPLGLLISVVGGARRTNGPDGLILAYGYRYAFPVAGAFTVGNVVVTKHPDGYLTGRLLDHESRHATQWGLVRRPADAAAVPGLARPVDAHLRQPGGLQPLRTARRARRRRVSTQIAMVAEE